MCMQTRFRKERFPSRASTRRRFCFGSGRHGGLRRWFVFVQQVACFLAIPVQGAHFVSDMIAGAAIGAAALVASGAVMRIFVGTNAEPQLAPVGAGLRSEHEAAR